MYQGKHMKKSKKPAALLASLVLMLAIMAAGTVAFLVTNTGPVVNTFTPTNVPPEIYEEFDGKTKSNVTIENQGNTDAYIRAAVMVNWVDASGNVLGQVPVEGTDYTITYDLDNGWVQGADGYYYWTKVVEATDGTDLTGVLITKAEVKNEAPMTGYHLAIDIMAQTIQAKGESDSGEKPVMIAWGTAKGGSVSAVSTDGVLTIVTQ